MLDQKKILRRRDRAAKTYQSSAIVQQEINRRLIERLEYMLIKPKTVLDLGSATGYSTELLQNLYPDALVVSLDCSEFILREQQNTTRVCSDFLQFPLKDHSQELIIANFVLDWVSDPQVFFEEIARVLDPNGVLLLTALGLDTLKECRQAFSVCDQAIHVHNFFDMHDVGDLMLNLGFTDPVVDTQVITVNYKNLEQLFEDLRGCGSTNAHLQRSSGLMGKNKWKKMLDEYQTMTIEGKYPATVEIIFGHAWGVRVQKMENGEASISLSSMEKMLKNNSLF